MLWKGVEATIEGDIVYLSHGNYVDLHTGSSVFKEPRFKNVGAIMITGSMEIETNDGTVQSPSVFYSKKWQKKEPPTSSDHRTITWHNFF